MNELFDFIKDYGGYAGAASVLGLAVLSLLYFAQAREVKRLREWAGRAPERAAELEQRVTSDATRRTITPMPQRTPPPRPGQPQTAAAQGAAAKPPAPANGQPAGAPVPAAATAAAAGAAGAAAGAAAPGDAKPATPGDAKPAAMPAASAATPTATPEAKPGDADGDGKADPATSVAPKPAAPAGADAPAGAGAAGAPAVPSAPAGPAVPGGAVAAGAAGAAARPAAPTPPTPGGTTPPGPGPRTAAARPRPAGPAQPLRSTSPATTLPPARGGMVPDERPRRSLSIVAGVLAVLTVGLVLFFTVFSGDDEPQNAGDQPPTTSIADAPPPAGETTPEAGADRAARGNVQVAVFNGTTVNGLARRVAEKVEGGGWNLGTVDNAPPPEKSATIVWYAEGQRAQAREVAKVIDVGNDAVQQMDQNVRLLDDDARVIVIVGADQQQG